MRASVNASPTTPKRWVWEPIQNAKDVNIGGTLNDEYRMTLDSFLTRLEYLAQAIDAVNEAARNDYQPASSS